MHEDVRVVSRGAGPILDSSSSNHPIEEQRGLFSVKSAYHRLEDKREQEKVRKIGSSSSGGAEEEDKIWGQLWKLACAPKVKQFLWRLAHDSLPLWMNIACRGMDIDTRCPMCRRYDEDGGHCFLRCKKVRKC